MDKLQIARLRELYTNVLTVFNRFIDQSGGKDCPELIATRDQCQQMCAHLTEIEKKDKPTAEESSAVFASVVTAIEKVSQSVSTYLADAANKVKGTVEGLVTQGIADKVKAGEFISKADAEKAAGDAEKKARDRFTLINTRRGLVLQAKLPGEAAGEDLLGGDEKDFTAALTGAQEREKKMVEMGLTLNTAAYSHLAFAAAADWERQQKMLADVAATVKARKGGKPDPLAGGAGGAGGQEDLPV